MKFSCNKWDDPDILLCIKENHQEILMDDIEGLLIRDRKTGYDYADAHSERAAHKILQFAESVSEELIIRGRYLNTVLNEYPAFQPEEPYQFYVYQEPVPPNAPDFTISQKRLDEKAVNIVCQYYSNRNLATEEYISQRIKEGMYGAYVGEKLAGFIGIHDSGSIGMLEVLPSFRRQGIAKQLLYSMITERLKQGKLPFAEIHLDNEISKKTVFAMGFRTSGNIVNWCSNKKRS